MLQTYGLEKDRFPAHILGMRETRYEILEDDDGTFTVEIFGGDGADAAVTQFGSREEAVEWVREDRRRLGIDPRWKEAADD